MNDTQSGQAGTPPQKGTPTAPVSASGEVTGSQLTPEAVAAWLRANPTAAQQITVPVKLEGQTLEKPLAEVINDWQAKSVSTKRFQEAKAALEEAERLKAELDARGDPLKEIGERLLGKVPQPPPEPDPLSGLDDLDLFASRDRLAQAVALERKRRESLEAELARLKALESKLPEIEKVATTVQQQFDLHQKRLEYEREFANAARSNPNFTGRVITLPDGRLSVDYGSNPAFTAEVLRIANLMTPDPRFGGRTPGTGEVTLAEIAAVVEREEEERVQARIKARNEAQLKSRQTMAGIVPGSGGVPPISAEISAMPENTPAERAAKAAKIREAILASVPPETLSSPL